MFSMYILMPVLDGFIGLICTILESGKVKYGLKISEYNHKISQVGTAEKVAYPIGFQIPKEDDESEDENQIL